MRTPIECIVIEDGNCEAIERIIDVTQPHDHPESILLTGPQGCGKTMLLKARFLEKDLLSIKKVSYYTCAELPAALREGVSNTFLDWLGEVDVLLLDDAEGFLEDAEAGPLMCKLLLAERQRLGLDTVVSSRMTLEQLAETELGEAFAQFAQIQMAPLGQQGRKNFVRSLIEDYSTPSSPGLSAEADFYLANELDPSLDVVDRAVRFLMTEYLGEPGRVLSLEQVSAALA